MVVLEDKLLKLLEDSGVKIGAVKPRVIQAWFDTDCSDLLKWMCCYIKEENYLSNEEEYEFNQLGTILSKEQTFQGAQSLENEMPGLFKYEDNACSVEYLKDMIEICEDQEKECDNLLNINQLLYKNLLNEYDAIEETDDNYQRDLRILQEKCLSLSKNLGTLYNKNILKHHSEKLFVTHTESSLEKLKQSFFNITNVHDVLSPIGCYPPDSLINPSLTFEILELQKREHLKLSLDSLKSQNESLMIMIKEGFLKLSQKYVDTMQLEYYQSLLNFHKQILLNVAKTNGMLYKFCAYFILLLNIGTQEKEEIVVLRCFLQNISTLLHDCRLRKMAMSNIADQCNKYTSNDLQQTSALINAIGLLLSADNKSSTEISKKTLHMKHTIGSLRKSHLEKIDNNYYNSNDLIKSIEFIRDFLESEATCRLVIIPHSLELAVRQVNEDINNQNESLKDAIKETQNAKK